MKHSLEQLAEVMKARLVRASAAEISGIAAIESATEHDLVFVEKPTALDAALASRAGAIVGGEFAADAASDKAIFIVRQPKLAFARAATLLAPRPWYEPGIHSSATIHHSAKIGKHVAIQPNAVITEGAVIGDRTRIGPGVAVGRNVHIGANCNIAANATIYPGTTIGDRVIIHAGAVLGADGFGYVRDEETGRYEPFPQVGTLEIQDDVEIGANATIDRGALGKTIIRRGTKLDNLVHVAHNVDIGEDVVIAGQTGISGSVTIGNGTIIAGQVGIADHVEIEGGAILGAQCGVPSNKTIRGAGVLFWGTPARPIKQYLKELAVLARLAKK